MSDWKVIVSYSVTFTSNGEDETDATLRVAGEILELEEQMRGFASVERESAQVEPVEA
jgi:hypothetical protein